MDHGSGHNDFEKREWQAQQAVRDALIDKEREKHRKARERSARNAQRKLERLRRQLGEAGEMSEWEDEFSESVSERLDKYGSAFADLEKGRPGDALSFAQKRVVAALNKKAKDKRKAARTQNMGTDEAVADEKPTWKTAKKRSSFSSKRKSSFKPRVRQLDEDFDDIECDVKHARRADEQFINECNSPASPTCVPTPSPKRPFLRLVSSDTQTIDDRPSDQNLTANDLAS